MVELVHSGRNLQTLAENLTLSLEKDITGPLDVSGDIHLGLSILDNVEIHTRTSPPIRKFLGVEAKMGFATLAVFLAGAYKMSFVG